MIPPILTVLKLIDQRNMTAVNDEFSTLNNFSAAMETIPLVPNTDGSSLFSRTSKTPLVGIYFGAQWCPPCRAFSPTRRAQQQRRNEIPSSRSRDTFRR